MVPGFQELVGHHHVLSLDVHHGSGAFAAGVLHRQGLPEQWGLLPAISEWDSVLYHYDLGFESFIDANDGKNGAHLYDFASGHWFYTSPSFPFPYLYDFTLQSILDYYPDPKNSEHYTTNPRYFYNFATGMIITM